MWLMAYLCVYFIVTDLLAAMQSSLYDIVRQPRTGWMMDQAKSG